VKTGLSVSAAVGIEGETKRSGFVAYPLRGCADFKDTQPVENRSLKRDDQLGRRRMAPVVFSALRVSTVLAGIVLGISLLLVGLVKAAETESGCLVAPREGTPCLPRS